MNKLAEALEDSAIGMLPDAQMTDDMIDETLRISGMYYFGLVDETVSCISKRLNIVAVNHISMGYICDEIRPVSVWFFGLMSISKGSKHIDVVRSVVCPTSTIGNSDDQIKWMGFKGFIATNSEHAMIELLYDTEAVSTGKIFHAASAQGIAIHVLDDPATLESDLSRISAHSVVKNHIRAYVNADHTAMIPQRSVTVGDWSGQGWIVVDETTGAAGYMICGGLYGDNAVLNGGSGTNSINNLVAKLLHLAHIAKATVPGLAALSIALNLFSTLLFFLESTLPLLILVPFAIFFWVLGVVFLCAAYILLVKLVNKFTNMPHAVIRRRKEYAYA